MSAPDRPESVLKLRSAREQPDIRRQRERLLQATAIVQVVQHATLSKLEGLTEETTVDALRVAQALIDDVAEALEPLESPKFNRRQHARRGRR